MERFGEQEQTILELRNNRLLVLTVGTERTDGFLRYFKSANYFKHDVEVLGKNQEWTGGNVKKYPGGGQKVRLLKEKLQNVQAKAPDTLILFTDGYDVVINGNAELIIARYAESNAEILFSAEEFCWPDESLKSNFNIKLDHTSNLFQNLNGVADSIELYFDHSSKESNVAVRNLAYSTNPLVIHGNGNSKIFLNYLGNYIGGAWKTGVGCKECAEAHDYFISLEDASLPVITLALFIEHATPFLEGFFNAIADLKYPKSKIHLVIHNNISFHEQTVQDFFKKSGEDYASVTLLGQTDYERSARNQAIDLALNKLSEFLFVVDSDVRITNPSVITKLMDTKKPIVAPMVSRVGKLFSNFWGALNDEGFYSRSDDYVEIVEGARRGIFNVPHIASVYLIKARRLKMLRNAYSFESHYDPDMSFTRYCLEQGFFMYVCNQESYGYLVNADNYDIRLKHPDFYELFDNRLDWESCYLHESYPTVLNSGENLEQPCPDVYWFPIFTRKFCRHLIDIMENYGKWSSGSNHDERLSGGYENVPTRDIHTNQVGLERHWLHMLDQYFRPVQEKVFVGYHHVPPHAIMNFVVRYRPDEQPYLKPHHDASTYTINLALNEHGVDYQGGGSHFLRYNCSVIKGRPGWALMHPGRLTHYHEGLPTTQGTRYIMVSFVDP